MGLAGGSFTHRFVMPAPKSPKKSESLEIRIPHPTKQAFMARCQAEGRSASEVLRDLIDRRLEAAPAQQRSRRRWRLAAGALVVAGMAAAAAPTLARPSLQAEFQRLDANRDQVVTLDELSRADADGDGAISFAEYRRHAER
jgi:hypothetical protein